MDGHEHLVHDAVLGKHGLEDHRIGHQGGDAGQEDGGAEPGPTPEIAVIERIGEQQGQDQHDRHLDGQEGQRIGQRPDEDRILGQAQDIGEAAKAEIHAAPNLEAHPERPQDRIDHEDAEQDQRRHDKEPAIPLFSACQTGLRHANPHCRSQKSPMTPAWDAGASGRPEAADRPRCFDLTGSAGSPGPRWPRRSRRHCHRW